MVSRVWIVACIVFAALLVAPASARADQAEPWRLQRAAGLPAWLELGLTHRGRYEALDEQFRAGADSGAMALSLRTLLAARLRFEPITVGLELQDSRAFASDDTPLNTTIVNAAEVLQAYVGARRSGVLGAGDELAVKVGRITMDVGSRRLVARNLFRNTINGFTGIDAQWTSRSKLVLRAFAVMPVTRRPGDADSLADNAIELDKENTDALFSGAFASTPLAALRATLEVYALGLNERDGEVASRNRRLLASGLRLVRGKQRGELDYEVEAVGQVGKSRTSAAADNTRELDHRAFFVHAQVGKTFDTSWTPRLIAQYDYASGDGDPDDEANGRFDTLFGARRFELGPAGIFGSFARSNLNTPGLRVQVAPARHVDGFVAYRLYWLASARDAWTTAGVRDASGASGKFLGHQVEGRVRWNVLPKNLRLEVGGAYLLRGRFAKTAPDTRDDPAVYVYTQVVGTI